MNTNAASDASSNATGGRAGAGPVDERQHPAHPRMVAAGAVADVLGALLGAVDAGELDADPISRALVTGAREALRVVAD